MPQRFIVFLGILAALAGCNAPSGGGGGIPNHPGGDNDAGGGNGGGMVTLTVISRADDATAIPGAIYAFVSDHVLSRFEIDANRADIVPVIPLAHGTPGEVSADLTVERGRTVTLIAVEGLGGILVSRSDDLAAFTAEAPPEATEFRSWDGDVDSVPEVGLAALTADRDRTVIADYSRMRGVLVEWIGCGSLAVGWAGSEYLDLGPLIENSQAADSAIARQTGQTHPFVYVYNKLGTTFRFVIPLPEDPPADAVEFVATGFDHWGGAGSTCGGDPLCREVTRNQSAAADQTLQVFNTFTQELPEVTVTNGYGCGACITFDPTADCDAFRAKLVTPN